MKGLKIILALLSFLVLVIVGFAQAKIIPVPTPEYPTIQDGIDAAVDGDTVVSGFTIQNGYVDDGGGILCSNSSPTITNSIITNNFAAWAGGGINCSWDSSATITNNTIINNRSNGHGGGGIFLEKSSPIIDNNNIHYNIEYNFVEKYSR